MKGTDADTWLTAQEKAAMAAIERNRMPEPVEDVPMPESYAELAVEEEEEDKEEEVEKGGSGDEVPDKLNEKAEKLKKSLYRLPSQSMVCR